MRFYTFVLKNVVRRRVRSTLTVIGMAVAVGAVVALFHDVLVTLGMIAIFNGVFNLEINQNMIAAFLTLVGLSVNDTVVIFDRMRENQKIFRNMPLKELMNKSLNETLSRTIITSGTVFIATLALYLVGGSVINDFAFAFLVGIVTGTYSSIYIASAFVWWWHKGERPNIGASQVTIQNVAPAKG